VECFLGTTDAVVDFQAHERKNKLLKRGDQDPACELIQNPVLTG
jgi:hypothetical protein